MAVATGVILVVQETRFRLLADDGSGHIFLLAHDAPLEPQDLPRLTHRRVRVAYDRSPTLIAGIARDIQTLDERRVPP
jgi:hypothetical protein